MELLPVVAVGAVLILDGLAAYRLASENDKANQVIPLLCTLKQQVQQAYQGQASYGAGNLVDGLTALQALPRAGVGLARHFRPRDANDFVILQGGSQS